MDNEKLVFIDADFSIEKFAMDKSARTTSDNWETEEF